MKFEYIMGFPLKLYYHFVRPKLKTSGFGVKKGLSIEKMPAEKIGALVAHQIHLKVQSSGFFYAKEG